MNGYQQSLECMHEELAAERRRELHARRAMKQLARDLGSLGRGAPASDHSLRAGLQAARARLEALRAELTSERRRSAERTAAALAQLQAQLARARDLRVLGELSASVAHEIRNPLCGIRLSAEVLQTKMDAGDSRMVLLANLQREAEKMEKIVNNLLHFSRHYKPRLARCDLTDVVARSVESVQHRLRKKQIEVIIHSVESASEAHADADLLQQVFGNIIANAVDACPAGSRIRVELVPCADPDCLTVTVRDPGEGIAPEMLDRVFDPFYTSKVNGVGLGLSVTKKIVDAHGGHIEVASRLGEGTAFTVVLPRQPQMQPAEVAA